MANRMFKGVKSLGREFIIIAGSFRPNGSSAVSSATVVGKGFTVARTNAGIFTITLQDSYPRLIHKHASVQLATAADMATQWGAIDVSTAKTLVLRTQVADVATDIASDAGNIVSFELILQNTTLSL